MKAAFAVAALLGVVTARPHPADTQYTKLGKRDLAQNIAALASQLGVKEVNTSSLSGAPINQWNAIGDSFAAGAGSNGDDDYDSDSGACLRYKLAYGIQTNSKAGDWPKTVSGDRGFTHGACGGTTTDLMVQYMLSQDIHSVGAKKYLGWGGQSDISTLTVGGNDVGFSDILASCILGIPFQGKCQDKLTNSANLIKSDDFAEKLTTAIMKVIAYGQQQNGKEQITYQLFINNYVPFWNEVDTGCDTVQWSLLGLGLNGEKLTTDLRKQMNALSTSLNALLGEIATGLAKYGAVFVDGWQDSFQGHQFCDPAADSNLESPTSANTWFWHYNSADDGSEGSSKLLGTSLFEALVPDENERKQISADTSKAASVNPIFQDIDSFEKAVYALGSSGDYFFPKTWAKMFHPKGTPLGIQADFNVKAVLNARKGLGTCEVTGTTDGLVLKSDLQAAIDQVKAMSATSDCTGGGAISCSIIAQSGTAAIALCTDVGVSAAESVQCGSLDSILDSIMSTCVGDRNGIDQATAPTGTNGLTVQISRGSTT